MQAKLKSHQETWVLGGGEMFRGTAVRFLLHPASRKGTITQANMHSSALAARTRKLFLQNNSSFFKHASAHRLIFTHVGQHCCFVFVFCFFQIQPLPLPVTHGFAAELWICHFCPVIKDIFVNRGLSQGKMPAERRKKNTSLLPWSTLVSWSNLSCCKMAVWAQLLGDANIRGVLFVFVESASWVIWAQ